MTTGRTLAAVCAAATLAPTVAGCGLGPGPSADGAAELTVTRDYGAEEMLHAGIEDPAQSDTVIRALDREAEVTTRYGGGFVQSIEGLAGTVADGRSLDWFFYVNGVESSLGAAEVPVRAGDRIWWDYRDWSAAMRVPAVVGSWPEPFAQESRSGAPVPVRVVCEGQRAGCDEVAGRLASEGVDVSVEPADGKRAPGGSVAMRVLVGPWEELRDDPVAAILEHGPQESGVFVKPRTAAGGRELVALDRTAAPARELGRDEGLVAALREGEQPPTWLVTAAGAEGVEAAAGMLDEASLADRYAVAGTPGEALPLPISSSAIAAER